MASQWDGFHREGERLKSKVRTLINNDLKEICRAEHLPVSGVKAVLQQRVIQLVDTAVQSKDPHRFEHLKYRIGHNGSSPPPSMPPKPAAPPSMSSLHSRPGQPSTVTGRQNGYSTQIHYRKSPFFDILEPLTRTMELPVLPQNRQTIEEYFSLATHTLDRLLTDKSLRIMLYCASEPPLGHFSSTDISFPHQIDIRVNDNEIKANTRGLKNKPGSTRPVDLTHMTRLQSGVRNRVSIMYALTQKKFYFVVNLVRKHSVDHLLSQIKRANVISKQSVLAEMARNLNDEDIVATSTVLSLKCPISFTRIQNPCRSSVCSHHQCFDAAAFLQLQEQAPTWTCPVCSKIVSFEGLAVDKYVEEILASTKSSVDQVTIEPSGDWHVAGEESQASAKAGMQPAVNGYDSDSDDLVEISDYRTKSMKPRLNGNMQTPPFTSRETSTVPRSATGKREVIDLTLSSDEEEPRPAKRPAFTPQQHSTIAHRSPSYRAAQTNVPPPTNGQSHIAPIRLQLPRSNAAPTQRPDPQTPLYQQQYNGSLPW